LQTLLLPSDNGEDICCISLSSDHILNAVGLSALRTSCIAQKNQQIITVVFLDFVD